MSRPRALLDAIDRPDLPPPEPKPEDAPLWSLLVHLAADDGSVGMDEFGFLARLRPDLDDAGLFAWANPISEAPIDWPGLARFRGEGAFDVMRLAARMVALDGEIDAVELGILDELARVLALGAGAPRASLDEVVARGGGVQLEQVKDALRNMWWDVLLPSRDPLESDLDQVVPPGSTLICSIRLGNEEVAGLHAEGLAARFDGGPAWVAWDQIASYTRVPVPGASFHLRTRPQEGAPEGVDHAMVDPRLRDVGALLDLVHGRAPLGSERESSEP
jgi:hypothetical protein